MYKYLHPWFNKSVFNWTFCQLLYSWKNPIVQIKFQLSVRTDDTPAKWSLTWRRSARTARTWGTPHAKRSPEMKILSSQSIPVSRFSRKVTWQSCKQFSRDKLRWNDKRLEYANTCRKEWFCICVGKGVWRIAKGVFRPVKRLVWY